MEETPLGARHRQAGAAMTEVDGVAVPARFGPAEPPAEPARSTGPAPEEARALDEGAALADLSWRTHIAATGRHRDRFLHNMTTCQVKALGPGEGRFGMTVDAKGKLVGAFFLDVEPERLVLEVRRGLRDRVVEHLLRHRVADRIELAPVDGLAVLALVGPAAEDVLAAALGEPVGLAAPFAWRDATLGPQHGGIAVRLRRNDQRLARPGWDVTVAEADAPAAWAALEAAGARPVGHEAWEAARVEAAVPLDGVDMTEDNVPLEAARLYETVDWDKGCYIGQEVLAMMHYRGRPNRHLVRLRLDPARALPAPGAALATEDGAAAGVLGTAVHLPDGGALALGVVKRKLAEDGRVLRLPDGGPATVLAPPA